MPELSADDRVVMTTFELDLAALINRYSQENWSNTPDFILASYLSACLVSFNEAVRTRDAWLRTRSQSRTRPAMTDQQATVAVVSLLVMRWVVLLLVVAHG